MPYSIRTHMEDGKKCYSVITTKTGNVHSKCTTLDKAKAQLRLLKATEEKNLTKQKKLSTINKTMNPWIAHVKKFAEKKKIPYSQALKDPDVKKGYKSKTKGGAVYGDRDDTDDEQDTFSMGKLADALPSVAPARVRKIVRAKKPPTKPTPEAKTSAGESRKKVRAKRPSTTDPKRVVEKADFLMAMIESSRLDGELSQRQAKMLVDEIKEVLKEPRLTFEEKMAELLSTEKSLRIFTNDVSPDPF